MHLNPSRGRVAGAVLLAALLGLSGCRGGEPPEGSRPADPERDSVALILQDIPPMALVSEGGGQPRTDAYWVQWSTCGEGSRAETAAANGGREAGWILVDDLLEDPGVALGQWLVATCEDAVAVLQSDASALYELLARQLLAAELNLSVGSATCAAAAQTVVAGHVLLSSGGYGGPAATHGEPDGEVAASMGRVSALLSLYNTGRLCR